MQAIIYRIGKQLYSTGDSIHHLVINHNGKENNKIILLCCSQSPSGNDEILIDKR